MKKITLLVMACAAIAFASCNRSQHTYTATTNYHLLNPADQISVKAVLGTINSYWDGDYTFTGNDEGYTDLKAEAKYAAATAAILLHGDEIKEYLRKTDYFLYNLYRESDKALLESTKFYVDGAGNFTYEEIVDNIDK